MVNKIHSAPIPSTHSFQIEQILKDSVDLFERSGLEDLAQKWDKILTNYRKLK